jgi:ornithine--oxo-acid transaminase
LLILGKALGGGVLPVSCVLGNDEVMLTLKPGQHGSTFGGNPLACAVALASLKVVNDEKLVENATKMGEIFRASLKRMNFDIFETVRGKGLLNAVVIKPFGDNKTAYDICIELKNNGLLAKQTHTHIIRFAPPLIINEEQIHQACKIIEKTISEMLKK